MASWACEACARKRPWDEKEQSHPGKKDAGKRVILRVCDKYTRELGIIWRGMIEQIETVNRQNSVSKWQIRKTKYTQYIEINGHVQKFNTIILTIICKILLFIFHIVGFCPLLCCGILSCGILSCGILSVGILSCGILSRICQKQAMWWEGTEPPWEEEDSLDDDQGDGLVTT